MMERSLLLLVSVLVTTSVLAEEACRRQPLTDFYSELGCVPRLESDAKCPTSYDCSSHEQRDKTKCTLDGKQYNAGENMGDKYAACSAACSCRAVGDTTAVEIICANIECPDQFMRPKPGCYHKYDHESCCAKTTICDEKEKNPSVTCTHGNSTYLEGQKFYPEEEPCKVCICGAGYQGRAEAPFCKDIQCNTQLHSYSRISEGCVPVFYGAQGCCPIDWRCPEKEDKVRAARTKERTQTSETCKFGSLVLAPGDALQGLQDSPNVDCSCQLPPYITCISRPQSI